MITLPKSICAGLVLASTVLASQLRAGDDARDLALKINSANSLLRDGKVEAAITAYQQAQEHGPNSADLSYNLAVAQYRKGDVSAAERLFQSTAAADNDALAAKSRYNLGNCKFASALRDAEKDRSGAIKGLESAITHYRSSLDIEPTDADARANIERAAALIEKLRNDEKKEQQKQQQQNSQQQQKQGEKQDKSEQSESQKSNGQKQHQKQDKGDDKQKSQAQQQQQQSQPSSNDENKDKQSKQNQPSQAGDQSKKENPSQDKAQQQNQKNSTGSGQQQTSKPQEQPQSQKDKSQSQSAGESKQQDATSAQPQSQPNRQQRTTNERPEQSAASSPDEQNEKQGKTPPKGALAAAGKDDPKGDKNESEVAAIDSAKDGEMTIQEAQKMLQSIRDRDMLRRLRRQTAERDRHVPVDRDW
jgi:Ca-activated chloride channel family protein